MICGEHILKSSILSVIIMVLAGWLVGATPAEIVASVFARIGVSFLLIAANLLTERLFEQFRERRLQLFFYFIVLIVC